MSATHIPGHRILFVDVGGSGRAVMAAAFARNLGLDADAAGTMEGHEVKPQVAVAMKEKGLDVSAEKPQHVDFLALANYDRIVSMGPGVHQTDPALPYHEDWNIPDAAGQPVVHVRELRDRIERKVAELVHEMRQWSGVADTPIAPLKLRKLGEAPRTGARKAPIPPVPREGRGTRPRAAAPRAKKAPSRKPSAAKAARKVASRASKRPMKKTAKAPKRVGRRKAPKKPARKPAARKGAKRASKKAARRGKKR